MQHTPSCLPQCLIVVDSLLLLIVFGQEAVHWLWYPLTVVGIDPGSSLSNLDCHLYGHWHLESACQKEHFSLTIISNI